MEYDIFREELAVKYPAYGHALWEPNPGGRYASVAIGDVGFVRKGYFHRLFNVLLPEDHESHRDGVPQHHEPLVLRMSSPTDTGTLQPNNFRSNGVSNSSDAHRRGASGPDEAAQLSFSCPSRRRGAILSLPVPAQRKDTAVYGAFAKCIIKHIDHWFAFARERGLGISREDIVLITGCHLARSWANIVFQESLMEERVSFGVEVSGTSDVNWRFTPEGAGGMPFNLGPSGQNLPEDQCIFVRGFRATRFTSRIFPWLRGAAGPARIPGEDDPDPDSDAQLVNIPADTHYQDPLHTLLEYIAARAPDCDMALVHDDDLLCIDYASLDSLEPDTLMTYLRKSAPKIWQIEYDCSPTIHNDKDVSTTEAPPQPAAVKIATLSKYTLEAPAHSLIAHDFEMNQRRPMTPISSLQQSPQTVRSADPPVSMNTVPAGTSSRSIFTSESSAQELRTQDSKCSSSKTIIFTSATSRPERSLKLMGYSPLIIPIPKEILHLFSFMMATLDKLAPVQRHYIETVLTIMAIEMVFRKYVGQSNRDILSAIFLLFLLGRFVWFVWSNLKHVRNQLDDMYGRIEALHQSIKSLESTTVVRPPTEYGPVPAVPNVPPFPREGPSSTSIVNLEVKPAARRRMSNPLP